ncbi:MAG TPA: hypothetical protein VM364_00710 [Vicinamibacterales bacterium]|nr:hypothetical protein [Vicinamibacterales bacterium]
MKRPRIVKPRTAKQRAHAQRYSARATPPAVAPKDTGLPAYSWWAYAPADGFTTIAQIQSRRMRRSQFGSVRNPTFGDEA